MAEHEKQSDGMGESAESGTAAAPTDAEQQFNTK